MTTKYKTIKNGGLKVVELSSLKIAIGEDVPAASWTRYDALNQVMWDAKGLIKLEYKVSEKTGKISVKRLDANRQFYRDKHAAWKAEAKRINDEITKIEKDNQNLGKQSMKLVTDAETGEVKRYVKRASHRNSSQPHHMTAKTIRIAKVKAAAPVAAPVAAPAPDIAEMVAKAVAAALAGFMAKA